MKISAGIIATAGVGLAQRLFSRVMGAFCIPATMTPQGVPLSINSAKPVALLMTATLFAFASAALLAPRTADAMQFMLTANLINHGGAANNHATLCIACHVDAGGNNIGNASRIDSILFGVGDNALAASTVTTSGFYTYDSDMDGFSRHTELTNANTTTLPAASVRWMPNYADKDGDGCILWYQRGISESGNFTPPLGFAANVFVGGGNGFKSFAPRGWDTDDNDATVLTANGSRPAGCSTAWMTTLGVIGTFDTPGFTADVTLPTAIGDFRASGLVTQAIPLAWTAVGDDGMTGSAHSYDIRYTQSNLMAANTTCAVSPCNVRVPADWDKMYLDGADLDMGNPVTPAWNKGTELLGAAPLMRALYEPIPSAPNALQSCTASLGQTWCAANTGASYVLASKGTTYTTNAITDGLTYWLANRVSDGVSKPAGAGTFLLPGAYNTFIENTSRSNIIAVTAGPSSTGAAIGGAAISTITNGTPSGAQTTNISIRADGFGLLSPTVTHMAITDAAGVVQDVATAGTLTNPAVTAPITHAVAGAFNCATLKGLNAGAGGVYNLELRSGTTAASVKAAWVNAITITPANFTCPGNAPTVTLVSPNSRGQGATSQIIVIDGTDFTGATTVNFGTNITHASAFVINSAIRITATINVAAAAATGVRSLIVTNATGPSTATNNFTVNAAPVISTCTPTNGVVGQAYSYTSCSASPASTWTATGLPPGLTINASTGAITGTPTATGTSGGSVIATATGDAGTFSVGTSIFIQVAPPVITSANAVSCATGSACSYQITATNSPTSYSSTALPAGLTLNTSTGLISGTPTVVASTSVTVTATNAGGNGPLAVTFNITLGVPAVNSATSKACQTGVACSYTITATNSPTSFTATPLAAGLALNATTGVISGTPTTVQTVNTVVTASNVTGPSPNVTVVFTITLGPPAITSALTKDCVVNTACSYSITATNSPTSYGATPLPPGMTVNTTTGVISGTPTTLNATGTSVVVSATNATATGSATVVIAVVNSISPPVVTATQLNCATSPGCSYQITATNSPTSYTASPLPPGLTLNTATGVISGTPTTVGVTNMVVTASNGAGSSLNTTVVANITLGVPVITSANSKSCATDSACSYQITATNSPTSYSSTALPTGLTLNTSTGLISGTPTAVAVTSVTVTATNATGFGSLAVSFNITLGAPVITSANSKSCATGAACSYQITGTNSPASFTAAPLAAGLSLNASTGLISGTPTTVGTTNTVVTATNATATSPNVTVVFTITLGVPAITSATTASGTRGSAFSYTITATNSPTSYAAAPLPAGLAVNTTTGVISGIPTTAGTTNTVVTAGNGTGPSSPQTVVITIAAVLPGAPTINSVSRPSGTLTAVVNFTAPVDNGGADIQSYTASCTPTCAGAVVAAPATSITITGLTNNTSYTFTVRAANSVGPGSPSTASAPVYVSTDVTAPEVSVSLIAGTYLGTQLVTLTAADASPTDIYYTVNGTTPTITSPSCAVTPASPSCATPITITADTLLLFFGKDAAGNTSPLDAATYMISSVDLKMTAVESTTPGVPVQVGGKFNISSTEQNIGSTNMTAPSNTIKFYLSLDTTISTSDIALTGTRIVAAADLMVAAPGSTATTEVTVPRTMAPGTYYVGAIADFGRAQPEFNAAGTGETNNAQSSTLTIIVKREVDLVMTAVEPTVANAIVPAGGTFNISNTERNIGSTDMTTASNTVKFYLSLDTTISPSSDIALIGTRTVVEADLRAAAPSGSTAITLVTVPSMAPGTYYVGAFADSGRMQPEFNAAGNGEDNNTKSSLATIQVTLRPIDLQIVSVGTAVGFVHVGQPFSINSAERNNGSAGMTAVGHTVKFYLSLDSTITTSDIALPGVRLAPLLAGQGESFGPTDITVPKTVRPGTYYIGAIADFTKRQIETDEANNVRSSPGTIIVKREVDLVMSAGTVTRTLLTPATLLGDVGIGSDFTINGTVLNQGATDMTVAVSRVKFYLSLDTTIPGPYLPLTGIRTVTGALAAAGGTDSAPTTVTVPRTTASGTYRVIACADATRSQLENNPAGTAEAESNNCTAATESIVVYKDVDLEMATVTPLSGTVVRGSTLDINSTVSNFTGTTMMSAPSTLVKFYLSTNATLGPGDIALAGSRFVPSLGAAVAESTPTTTQVTVPVVNAGLYYIIAVVDFGKSQLESDETNNALASARFTVTF